MRTRGIYFKILFILIFTGLVFFILLTSLYSYNQRQEKLIFNESKNQFSNEINTLISVSGREIVQIVNDYTYWDDFVENVGKNDTTWFNYNIGSILESYNADYVCVYDSSFHLVYESSSENFTNRNLFSEAIIRKLKEEKFMNFYMQTSDSILEVSCGSIHPSNDPTHTLTQPSGYLFVVRSFNHYVIDDISNLINAQCFITVANDSVKSSNRFLLSSEKLLFDWRGQPLVKVIFSKRNESLELYKDLSVNMSLLLMILLIFTWFVVQISLQMWVIQPLKLIMRIFETEDEKLISQLKKKSGEFEKLGILFEQNMHHKKELTIAKEKAEESDRLKSAFLANMSHEIRTPMNGILGFTHLLKDSSIEEEERQEFIRIIEQSGDRMLNLINDIMNISKIEAGQMTIRFSEINITEVVEYVYSFFKLEAEQKGIELISRTVQATEGLFIKSDKEKIYAILMNLVKNAIKFTHSGSVEFGFEKEDKLLKFFVRDTGIGIHPDEQKFIFERFRKGNEKLQRIFEGTGLGLSISKAYVEMLEGKIWFDSELGKGSVFYFTIPFIEELK